MLAPPWQGETAASQSHSCSVCESALQQLLLPSRSSCAAAVEQQLALHSAWGLGGRTGIFCPFLLSSHSALAGSTVSVACGFFLLTDPISWAEMGHHWVFQSTEMWMWNLSDFWQPWLHGNHQLSFLTLSPLITCMWHALFSLVFQLLNCQERLVFHSVEAAFRVLGFIDLVFVAVFFFPYLLKIATFFPISITV